MDILQTALKNFDFAVQTYTPLRSQMREDLQYVAGLQANTSTDQDPFSLQVNLLGPFLRQITAEARSANPAVKVMPIDDADIELAELRQGIIRGIEQDCGAEQVYQNALWYAAAGGEGYVLLDSDYVADDSFDQELKLLSCQNPEMIFLDPTHEELTGDDAEWGFVIKDIPTETYKRQFRTSNLTERLSNGAWDRLNLPKQWITERTVRVAKYYQKEYTTEKLYLVQDPVTGETFTQSTPATETQVQLRKQPRLVQKCTIKAYLLNGFEVLEETDWPGTRVPIFKVTGDSFFVGGQQVQFGAVRQAKDSQRQYNYAVSRQTEMIDLAPKNSFVITTKQLGNNAEKWANANRISYGYLDYVADNGAPPPTRVNALDGNAYAAVSQAREQAYEDMKRVFGLNDASMGSVSKGDMSGVAIHAQVEQGSRSTYIYFDHLLMTITAIGRELNNLIPVFYDTERTVRAVKPTNEEQVIRVNSPKDGYRFDLTKGKFAVTVSTGPAYASKRQEAFDALNGIMQVLPQSAQVIGDLVASQVDSPIAKLVAARLKATLPPEVLAATEEDQNLAPREALQQAKAQVAQLSTQLKQLQMKAQEMELENKKLHDDASLKLTVADMNHTEHMKRIELDEQTAELEGRLKMMELALEQKKLELAEKQFQAQTLVAAHEMNEKNEAAHIKPPDADLSEVNIGDTNIGGAVDE